jgi:hypothetical protein
MENENEVVVRELPLSSAEILHDRELACLAKLCAAIADLQDASELAEVHNG